MDKNEIVSKQTDADLYASFSGTAATTQVIDLPEASYSGFFLEFEYTVTDSSVGTDAYINEIVDSIVLKQGSQVLFVTRAQQLAPLSLAAWTQCPAGGKTVQSDTSFDPGYPVTSQIYYDAIPTSTESQVAYYYLMTGMVGAGTMEVTIDPANQATISALSCSLRISPIYGMPYTGIIDIREETSETRNDIECNSPVQAVYFRTTTASDITKIESPSYTITNPGVGVSQNWNLVNGANLSETSKDYLIQKGFGPGQLSITGNTAEQRTVYVFYAAGVQRQTPRAVTPQVVRARPPTPRPYVQGRGNRGLFSGLRFGRR